jgi:uncharacterized protein YfeS
MQVGQLQYIISSWLGSLNRQQQEIIAMKNRIAEIAKGNVSGEILNNLEEFQNAFLNKDTVITFFRKDIQSLLQNMNSEEASYSAEKMQKDMLKMETEFSILCSSFHSYILKNVS